MGCYLCDYLISRIERDFSGFKEACCYDFYNFKEMNSADNLNTFGSKFFPSQASNETSAPTTPGLNYSREPS